MNIEWVDQPPGNSNRSRTEFIAELSKHPGRWAKYSDKRQSWGSDYQRDHNIEVVIRSGATYVRVKP